MQEAGRQESGRPQPPGLSHLSAGDPRARSRLWAQGAWSLGVQALLGATESHFYKLNP